MSTVTVLMSVYNSSAFLHEAIHSTLRQTHRDFEFLIVDDGSADDSLAICRSYAQQDGRIRILSHKNWGAPASLNHAASEARGDWLFRMDPDDVMLPNRLERQLQFIRRNPDLAVASSQVQFINERGQVLGVSRNRLTTRAAMSAAHAGPHLITLHHPAVAMRRHVFLAVGGYRAAFWPADDLDLWNRIAERGHHLLVQDEPLVQYRLHGSSISMTSGRHQVQTVDWVEDCKHRRRQREPERTFAEFVSAQQTRPWLQRLNLNRTLAARTFYKSAVQRWALRDYSHFAPAMLAAVVLQPELFLSRVLPRVLALVVRSARWLCSPLKPLLRWTSLGRVPTAESLFRRPWSSIEPTRMEDAA